MGTKFVGTGAVTQIQHKDGLCKGHRTGRPFKGPVVMQKVPERPYHFQRPALLICDLWLRLHRRSVSVCSALFVSCMQVNFPIGFASRVFLIFLSSFNISSEVKWLARCCIWLLVTTLFCQKPSVTCSIHCFFSCCLFHTWFSECLMVWNVSRKEAAAHSETRLERTHLQRIIVDIELMENLNKNACKTYFL